MLKDLFNRRATSSPPDAPGVAPAGRGPKPREVQAFVEKASQGDLDGITAYLDKYGSSAVDIPCPSTDYTALMKAAMHGNTALCQRLLERGADVNAANKEGRTALRAAASHNQHDTTLFLLKNAADPNKANEMGWTPLMGAAQNGGMRIVDLLLKNGADPLQRNTVGQTALDIAQQTANVSQFDRVVEILQDAVNDATDRADKALAAQKIAATNQMTEGLMQGTDRPVSVMKPMTLNLKPKETSP